MIGSSRGSLMILYPNTFHKQSCKIAITSLLLGRAHFWLVVRPSRESGHIGGSSLEPGYEQLVARILHPSVQNRVRHVIFSHTQVRLKRTTDKPIKVSSLPISIWYPNKSGRSIFLTRVPRRSKILFFPFGLQRVTLYST